MSMRSLARHIAKVNMKKKGMSRFCKDKGSGSYFSKHWRKFVNV